MRAVFYNFQHHGVRLKCTCDVHEACHYFCFLMAYSTIKGCYIAQKWENVKKINFFLQNTCISFLVHAIAKNDLSQRKIWITNMHHQKMNLLNVVQEQQHQEFTAFFYYKSLKFLELI